MESDLIKAVRITQIVKDEGWVLVDNGYNTIDKVVNQELGKEINFDSQEGFITWLFEQGTKHSI